MIESLLTVKELAKYLNVCEKTIYRYADAGIIPATKFVGSWRFNKEDVVGAFSNGNIENEIKREKPRVLSLFSGCGGLDLGFHQRGYQTVWANDIDQYAAQTFSKYFSEGIMHCQDIEKIDPYNDNSIPECDLILGGFPCQDFSVIWKRPGLDGDRGSLYKSFLRFVDAKKPKAFVAENVKGLLSANKHKAIETIIKDFENIAPGYIVKVQLYNFAEYGVPQLRERVLIVGVRKDTNFDFYHPQPTHGTNGIPMISAGMALEGVENVAFNNEHMNIKEKTKQMLELIPEGGNFTDIPKDHPLYVKGMISHVYRRIQRSEPSKTIIAAGGGGTWGYHYPETRPLTNRERARLQSFPDDFVFLGSITEVRRQIGNAVPPVGVHALADALMPLFKGDYTKADLCEISNTLKELPIKERLKFDHQTSKQREAVAV
jgi:DNA (cytosine-5)-methyltransferase 1